MTRNTTLIVALILGLASTSHANYNSKYGEVRLGSLPEKGTVSKNIWVGSWWSYKMNGIAYRQNAEGDMKVVDSSWSTTRQLPDGWKVADNVSQLSPAEKYDKLMGRDDLIERDKIAEYLKKIGETESEITGKIERRRELIRVLNKIIKENQDEDGFDWKSTDEGKEYEEISAKIEEAEAALDELKPKIDTATEYEIWKHGAAQYGVQSWWGHCNAWAAAAVMEPEPRLSHTVDGIEFTAGDVKALLTEAWMELQSSFYGARNDFHADEESRDTIDYQDVTPAAFHIFFADQVGNHDKSFVIDRYTGDQVWNQPVKAYRSTFETLNDGQPVKKTLKSTQYPHWGEPVVRDLREQEIYEVAVTTTIHWVTDGVPHEALTVENYSDTITDEQFASWSFIKEEYHEQIEIRTLSYTLWLTKPMEDPEAEIIGDGEWNHGESTGYEALHPDFMWQPTANVNGSRDYENDFIDYDYIVETLLPGTLKAAEDPTVEPAGSFTFSDSRDIPDDSDEGTSIAIDVAGSGISELREMTVSVRITHTYIGDLQITLIGPNGEEETLKERRLGGSSDNIDETYDVKSFAGIAADGTWTLRVSDHAGSDTGYVGFVELNFK
jgi:hypothetical protein